MFYCEECRERQDWPEGFSKSHGPCELCGQSRVCHDVPSSALYRPKGPPETKTRAERLQDREID
jgi:hypothetical protein